MSVPKGSTKARVPTTLKEQKGSYNTTLANHREPRSKPMVPEAPKHLSKKERECWDKFSKVLDPMRVTTAEDFAALELLVVSFSQWSQLQEELRGDDDLTYETHNKYGTMRRMKPEFQAASDLEHRMLNYLGRFGLTPADRGRVNQAPDDNEANRNPEDEFTGGSKKQLRVV
jgi:P27 family predicted phage terminase small subunit